MSQIDVSPFLEDFFLANTPGYFLRKTLSNPHLRNVLDTSTDESLQAAVQENDRLAATSSERVIAYVALVALLKRGGQRAVEWVNLHTPTHLQWASTLVAEWDANRRVSQVVHASFNPVWATQGKSLASNTTTTIVFDAVKQ